MLSLGVQPVVRANVDPLDSGGEHGIRLHYVSCRPPADVEQKGTILLIHGFPETWYQFRRVMTPLSNAGYHVVVPDYRGAGASSKPSQYEAVFTKTVMAEDLHLLMKDELKVEEKVHVVGHDM
jgi:pimeloyl-ACP methyl ester carboxylesterase